jgi:hypothetical protein
MYAICGVVELGFYFSNHPWKYPPGNFVYDFAALISCAS